MGFAALNPSYALPAGFNSLPLGTIWRGIMSHPHTEIPARAPAATSADDTILPFKVEALDLRGRVVRFGPAVDTILSSTSYTEPVGRLQGGGVVLTGVL